MQHPLLLSHRFLSARSGRAAARGFTLVELLVVVAIIGGLAGLLLPAVQSARAAARRTQCSVNIREVALGIIIYADAHRGRFPSRTHTDDDDRYLHWIEQLAPFVENVDLIRLCPDDPLGSLRMNGLPGSGIEFVDPLHPDEEKRFSPQTSYVANGYLSFDDQAARSKGINDLDKLIARSKTVMLFEKASDPAVLADTELQKNELLASHFDHTHSPTWFRWYPHMPTRVLDDIAAEIQIDRHSGGSHFAYADGHVALISEDAIANWISAGYDFAKPNQ